MKILCITTGPTVKYSIISLVSMIPIKFIRIWKKHFSKYDPVPMSEHKAVIKCKSNLKIDTEDYPVL